MDPELSWDAFDISGHVFLILHSSLLIMEEINRILVVHSSLSISENLIRNLAGLILVIWYLMLNITCLYFHHILEITAGAILGMAYWVLIYGVLKNHPIIFSVHNKAD